MYIVFSMHCWFLFASFHCPRLFWILSARWSSQPTPGVQKGQSLWQMSLCWSINDFSLYPSGKISARSAKYFLLFVLLRPILENCSPSFTVNSLGLPMFTGPMVASSRRRMLLCQGFQNVLSLVLFCKISDCCLIHQSDQPIHGVVHIAKGSGLGTIAIDCDVLLFTKRILTRCL